MFIARAMCGVMNARVGALVLQLQSAEYLERSVAYRGGCWGSTLPRNSGGPPKSCQTQPDCENC